MQPKREINVERFSGMGITFLPTFLAGAVGVVARYDLPMLRYPAQMASDELSRICDRVNENLKSTYQGIGYYAHCPNAEAVSGEQVLVLFGDDEFYEDYMGNDQVTGG